LPSRTAAAPSSTAGLAGSSAKRGARADIIQALQNSAHEPLTQLVQHAHQARQARAAAVAAVLVNRRARREQQRGRVLCGRRCRRCRRPQPHDGLRADAGHLQLVGVDLCGVVRVQDGERSQL
jgi:hypothetical protein